MEEQNFEELAKRHPDLFQKSIDFEFRSVTDGTALLIHFVV